MCKPKMDNTKKWPYLVQKAKTQTQIVISDIAVKARILAKGIYFSIRVCKQIFSYIFHEIFFCGTEQQVLQLGIWIDGLMKGINLSSYVCSI